MVKTCTAIENLLFAAITVTSIVTNEVCVKRSVKTVNCHAGESFGYQSLTAFGEFPESPDLSLAEVLGHHNLTAFARYWNRCYRGAAAVMLFDRFSARPFPRPPSRHKAIWQVLCRAPFMFGYGCDSQK